MSITLAQVEELIAARKLVCGSGCVVTEYFTDRDDELACPSCGFQFTDVPALVALVADLATPVAAVERVTFSQLSKGDRVQVMETRGRAAELNDYIAAPAKAPRRARWGTVVTVERTKANTIITINLGCNVHERLAFGSRTRITREIAASATGTGRILAETVARNTIAAAVEINAGSPFLAAEPVKDCFGRPALVVVVADRTYTVTGVDEFGAIRTAERGTVNPGAVAELDEAVYTSGLWAFARKPKPAPVIPLNPAGAAPQRVKVTRGRYVGETFDVLGTRTDGAVAIMAAGRKRWINPDAYRTA